MGALAVLLLSGLAFAQDVENPENPEKPYQPKHKIDFKLVVAEEAGGWSFAVEGTTDLPDGVTLRARVFALEEVDDFRGGKRIDEEALSYKPGELWQDFALKGGRFRETVFRARRRPYSLMYRAKLAYLVELQPPELARQVDEEAFELSTDMRKGTDADLEAETHAAVKEFSGELDEVQALFREFRAAFFEQQKKFDEKAWREMLQPWLGRVRKMAERNEDRWLLWAAWLERQGKFRIESFCDLFPRLAEECTATLKGVQDLSATQRMFDFFLSSFAEAREMMGFDTPYETETVAGRLAPFVDAVGRIREIVGANDRAAWAGEGGALRMKGAAALLALSDQNLIPRRGYERVSAMSDLFLRICDLADRAMSNGASPEDAAKLRELLKEHDSKLKDFKNYAGIK